jgi:hypothetical protein
VSWSSVLINRARRVGKTTAMVEACKKINATLVCFNQAQAKTIAQEYGIRTYSAQRDTDGLRGTDDPVLFDPEAVVAIEDDLLQKLNRERALREKAEARLERIRTLVGLLETATFGEEEPA